MVMVMVTRNGPIAGSALRDTLRVTSDLGLIAAMDLWL